MVSLTLDPVLIKIWNLIKYHKGKADMPVTSSTSPANRSPCSRNHRGSSPGNDKHSQQALPF